MNALARVLGALLLFSGAAQASTTLTATLTTDQEVPPTVPTTTPEIRGRSRSATPSS